MRENIPKKLQTFIIRFLFPLSFSIALIFLPVLSIAGIGYSIWELYSAIESNNWPSVQGVIKSSNVTVNRRYSSKTRDTVTYYASIKYEYAIDGVTYTNNRISFGDYGTNFSSHANSIVEQYKENMPVPVRYNPNHPMISVIVAGVSAPVLIGAIGMFVLSSIFLIICFYIPGFIKWFLNFEIPA